MKNIDFRLEENPEEYKQVIIKYKYKHKRPINLPYEIGSAYFHNNEWWVNFYNPFTFTKDYEVLGLCNYDY